MTTTIKHIVLFLGVLLSIGSTHAQTVAIPDAAFLAYLKTAGSGLIDNKDQLVVAKANTFADTLLLKGLGIKTLEGLQYFNNLRGLVASDNQLTSLPNIDNLTQLQTLNVRNNGLTTLPNLDNLVNLTNLYAENNQLTALPSLSGNIKLLSLQVAANKIKTLSSLSALVKLNILDVSNNQLTALQSLSALTNLERLYCGGNQIIKLPDLNALTNLKRINASRNLLTALPSFAQNTLLTELVADSNLLTVTPDLSALGPFKKIQLQNNYFTFDDFTPYFGRSDSASLDYSPQRFVNRTQKVSINEGEPLVVPSNSTDTLKGLIYSWYKNGIFIFRSTSKNFNVSVASTSDTGTYYCKITHLKLPTLTLVSDTTLVEIADTTNNPPDTRCPHLPKNVPVEVSNAQCTELGSFKLTFADKILDSIKLVVYDSQNVIVPGVSSTLYMGLKQGEYRFQMTPKNNECVYAQEQKVLVKTDKCNEIVLTPNNDGKDDILYFFQKGTATIFDKNGKTIKTLVIPTEWDGTNSEGILPQGYYLVKINNGSEYFNLSVIY